MLEGDYPEYCGKLCMLKEKTKDVVLSTPEATSDYKKFKKSMDEKLK